MASRVFVMPQPITRTGIRTHNPETVRIYGGKKGGQTAFKAYEAKLEGSALGTIFRKATDTSATPRKWMGKVGDPNGLLRNDPRSGRTVTRIEINISVTQEKIGADLYKLLSGGRFDVAKTRLATRRVMDRFTRGHALAQEWARQGIIETLRVMSRFEDGYKDFAEARTKEGGREYSFMEYIEAHHRPPDFLLTDDGDLVPLEGFVELLGVGRMLADTDFIGGGGGNAGFKWILSADGRPIKAKTYKIDPGFVLQCNSSANWAFNTYRNNDERKLGNIRDIQIANNHDGVTIKWDSLTADQQSVFLSSLQHGARHLSEEVLSFLFYREGHFRDLPEDIAQRMAVDFRGWALLQLKIYGPEIAQFKRENPLHQLRIKYIDRWGEMPLLLSGENVLANTFFTPLAIKEHRESFQPQAGASEGDQISAILGALPSTSQSIQPDELFAQTRHVQLLGPPGAGKTAFSQNIAFRWASGQGFGNLHAVYWIPLRRLNKELDPGGFLHGVTDPDAFLARAVAHILLEDGSLADACLAEIRNNRGNSLFILDGYDEADSALCEAIEPIFSDHELSILVTSRPGFTDQITTGIDQTIENTGFVDEEVTAYATRFFTRKEESEATKQRAESFLSAVRSNPDFFEISHNPLQLQILCSLWESESAEGGFPSSLSGLYQSMVEQLFRWGYHRRGEDAGSVPEDTKRSLFSTLGLIAQRGLAEGRLVIPERDVTAWLEGSQWSERDLLETGVLKISGSGANACCHFLHETFQAYLAAYWISNQSREEQVALIQGYRDNPSYRGVIPFLAGIVYQADATASKQNTKHFFEALCQNVVLDEESVRREFMQIMIKSINECTDYLGPLPAVEKLFEAHASLLKTEVEKERELSLHTAIREGRIHFLKWIAIRKGALYQRSSSGRTAMHAAAMSENAELINWLFTLAPKLLTEEDKEGWTPMQLAVLNGNLKAAQLFHKEAPSFYIRGGKMGCTLMHFAAGKGHIKVMEWLDGQDPKMLNKSDRLDVTPMGIACFSGEVGAIEWMCTKNPLLLHEAVWTISWIGITPMVVPVELGNWR